MKGLSKKKRNSNNYNKQRKRLNRLNRLNRLYKKKNWLINHFQWHLVNKLNNEKSI